MRYVDLFKQMKISEGFYFSYTYDLTHTLQYNMLKFVKKEAKAENKATTVSAEQSVVASEDGLPQIILDDIDLERAQSDEDKLEGKNLDDGPDLEDIFQIETDGMVESHSIK